MNYLNLVRDFAIPILTSVITLIGVTYTARLTINYYLKRDIELGVEREVNSVKDMKTSLIQEVNRKDSSG